MDVIKNIIEVKIENGNHMKLLCDCGKNNYKVMEFDIDLKQIEINKTQDINFINGVSTTHNEICNLILPVVSKNDEINFIIRDWK